MRIGRPEAPVLIDADTLDGNLLGAGSGTLPAADAIIGRVPLRSARPAGNWRCAGGDLAVNGGMLLVRPRRPAQILSAAQRQFRLHAGRQPDPRHRHAEASGERDQGHRRHHRPRPDDRRRQRRARRSRHPASAPDLQPEELTRLTEGVIALVNGGLSRAGADRLERRRRGHLDRRLHHCATWTWRRRSARSPA